jgi:hypothetical protein
MPKVWEIQSLKRRPECEFEHAKSNRARLHAVIVADPLMESG